MTGQCASRYPLALVPTPTVTHTAKVQLQVQVGRYNYNLHLQIREVKNYKLPSQSQCHKHHIDILLCEWLTLTVIEWLTESLTRHWVRLSDWPVTAGECQSVSLTHDTWFVTHWLSQSVSYSRLSLTQSHCDCQCQTQRLRIRVRLSRYHYHYQYQIQYHDYPVAVVSTTTNHWLTYYALVFRRIYVVIEMLSITLTVDVCRLGPPGTFSQLSIENFQPLLKKESISTN